MENSSTIFLSIASMLYMIMIAIVYFSKKRVNTSENKIFTKLITVSLASLFSEIYITMIPINMDSSLFIVSLKAYLILCVLWLSYFMEYVFIITRNNENKPLINYKEKYKKTYGIFWTVTIFITCTVILLPIYFFNEDGMKYSYGPSVNIVFGLSGVYAIIMLCYIIKNFKYLKNKGYIPIIFFVILLSVVGIVQKINPSLLLANTCFSLITAMMCYTIENPDIKIAKDLMFAKTIAEESRDRTLNILDEIDDELKQSFGKLQTFGYKKVDYQNMEAVVKELKYIKKYSIDFVDKATGVIEIGKIESGSLKLNEKDYSPSELLEELKKMLFYDKKNKKINVITKLETKIPSKLYGDKEKIQQLVLAVYDYLLEIISKEDLIVEVNSITVGRFSKLKFHFITKDLNLNNYICKKKNYNFEINNLNELELHDTNRSIKYNKILKMASLLDAKIDISKDEYDVKDLVLSIRQRITDPYIILEQQEENKGIKVKYFNVSNKRILVINKNNAQLREILLLLRPYKADVDVCYSTMDIKKKSAGNKTYDLIMIDDNIYNSEKTIEKLKPIKEECGYEINMVVLISNNKSNCGEEYIEEGFNDYIIKPINKKSINTIIKKYLR